MGFYPAFATEEIDTNIPPDYYCVEFALDAPHPVYQFKLRRSEENMLFFLVKENSKILNRLKVGHVLPMTYYSDGDLQPTKVLETHIQEIINETQGRFRGHCRIQLEIVRN